MTDYPATVYQSQVVQVGDIAAHYWRDGPGNGESADPLIMLHGMNASKEVFSRVMRPLAQHFDVIAVDILDAGENGIPDVVRGHSIDDMRDFVLGFMDSLGIQSAHFFGNCISGTMLSLMAVEQPERMKASVVNSPPFFDAEASKLPLFFRLLVTPAISSLIRLTATRSPEASRSILEGNVFDVTVLNDPIVDSHMAVYAQDRRWLDYLAAMLSTCMSWTGPSARLMERLDPSCLEKAHVNLLVLWGKENSVVPISGSNRVAGCDRFTVKPLDRCGHLAPFEVPQEVFLETCRFLGVV